MIGSRRRFLFLLSSVAMMVSQLVVAPEVASAVEPDLVPPAQVLVALQSDGWAYRIYPEGTPVPDEVTDPAYDDSGWDVGAAAFGTTGGPCLFNALSYIATPWVVPGVPLGEPQGSLILRRSIDIPAGATHLRIDGTIDNLATVYVNGLSLGTVFSGSCIENAIQIDVPATDLAGTTIELAAVATDFGNANFLDLQVTAEFADRVQFTAPAIRTVGYLAAFSVPDCTADVRGALPGLSVAAAGSGCAALNATADPTPGRYDGAYTEFWADLLATGRYRSAMSLPATWITCLDSVIVDSSSLAGAQLAFGSERVQLSGLDIQVAATPYQGPGDWASGRPVALFNADRSIVTFVIRGASVVTVSGSGAGVLADRWIPASWTQIEVTLGCDGTNIARVRHSDIPSLAIYRGDFAADFIAQPSDWRAFALSIARSDGQSVLDQQCAYEFFRPIDEPLLRLQCAAAPA